MNDLLGIGLYCLGLILGFLIGYAYHLQFVAEMKP